MSEECGPGWAWSEPLMRCVSVDPPTAAPALELPAVLDDYIRRGVNKVFEAVGGGTSSASDWATKRARTWAEHSWNSFVQQAQNGYPIVNIPGLGEVRIIPGPFGDGFGPYSVFGIPFRVKVTGVHPDHPKPNDSYTGVVRINAQGDAITAGLYWFGHPTEPQDPTPILHALMDIVGVQSFGMIEQKASVSWPPFVLHGLTFDEVAVYRVKDELKEELPEGWELEGTRLLKGSVTAGQVAYVLEHLQVEVQTTTGPQLRPLAEVLLPFVAAVSNHAQFTSP